MTWQMTQRTPSPMQARVALTNDDNAATPTTDYHAADALARRTLGAASLVGRGYNLSGRATRVYASQAY